MTKRYGMSTKSDKGKKKMSKAAKEAASSISYRLRTKYGLYGDMPKAKPLNKNVSKAKGKWVKDEFESGTYTTKKGKKETVSSWTFVGETKRKLGSSKPQ